MLTSPAVNSPVTRKKRSMISIMNMSFNISIRPAAGHRVAMENARTAQARHLKTDFKGR